MNLKTYLSGMIKVKKIRLFLTISILVFLTWDCHRPLKASLSPVEVVGKWIDLTLQILQFTPANSPTFASRTLGYLGLTMYESVVHSSPHHHSLAGQLQGLDSLPEPDKSMPYNWLISFNAAQAEILRNIYIQTTQTNKLKIDSLERQILKELNIHDQDVIRRSVTYGKNIALTIFNWSTTDGGHRGYLRNFDKTLVHPNHPGAWQPPLFGQSFSHFPLHPHWGKNRTFVSKNGQLDLPVMVPFDTMPGSPYYQQFLAVYEQEKQLTMAQKEAAIWWSDDPDDTCTPPGHSYYIAGQVIKQLQPDLVICAETMARLGMALADAFTNCWKWKYHFFSERPNTYINRYIDAGWESFWPDPPFPAFPSGHAIQAGAAATVLENLYGSDITIVDSLHASRGQDRLRKVNFVARRFNGFWPMAEEIANSRFYGGIHTPQDNAVGLDQGKIIAGHVNALKWRVN